MEEINYIRNSTVARDIAERAMNEGYKAGIREVMETTLDLAFAGGKFKIKKLFELKPEGQAKLKEWGIDD